MAQSWNKGSTSGAFGSLNSNGFGKEGEQPGASTSASVYRVQQLEQFSDERRRHGSTSKGMKSPQRGSQSLLSNPPMKRPPPGAGSSANSSDGGSYGGYGYRSDLGLSAEQEAIMSSHEVLDRVELLSENVTKSLSVQEQVTAGIEQFKIDIYSAIASIRSRLDQLELRSTSAVGIGEVATSDSESIKDKKAVQSGMNSFVFPALATNAAAVPVPNKLVKPSGFGSTAPIIPPVSVVPASASTSTSGSTPNVGVAVAIANQSRNQNQSQNEIAADNSNELPKLIRVQRVPGPGNGHDQINANTNVGEVTVKGVGGEKSSPSSVFRDKLIKARMQTLVKPKKELQPQSQSSEQSNEAGRSSSLPSSDSVDGRGIAVANAARAMKSDIGNNVPTLLMTTKAAAAPAVSTTPPFPATAPSAIAIAATANANTIKNRPRLVRPRPPTPDSEEEEEKKKVASSSSKSSYLDEAKTEVKNLCINVHSFDEVSTRILNLLENLKKDGVLTDLVDFIFDTIVLERLWANAGARLCQKMYQHPSGGKGFKDLLLARCQVEFNNMLTLVGTDPVMEKRAPGLICFLAELYLNIRKDENSLRNSIMALASIELMSTLLAIHGACHLKANILCTVEVLKLLKPTLLAEGGHDDGIRTELEKLAQQCKRLESSGATVLTSDLKKTLLHTSMSIKLMTTKLTKTTSDKHN